jgi:iron-sulfur cluster repair protein YtfE (RIC family)
MMQKKMRKMTKDLHTWKDHCETLKSVVDDRNEHVATLKVSISLEKSILLPL